MDGFGVRFRVDTRARFDSLARVFAEVRSDKLAGKFRDARAWEQLIPDDTKPHFRWINQQEREEWAAVRGAVITVVPEPAEQLGGGWIFDRVFEAIEEGEFSLLTCEMVSDGVADMRIDPEAYPYGGIGPFIALAEAFGFHVLGVNEYGRYQTREELLAGRRV